MDFSPFLYFYTLSMLAEDIFVVMLTHINREKHVAAENRNKP